MCADRHFVRPELSPVIVSLLSPSILVFLSVIPHSHYSLCENVMFKLLYIFPLATPICHRHDLQQHKHAVLTVCVFVVWAAVVSDIIVTKQKYCVTPCYITSYCVWTCSIVCHACGEGILSFLLLSFILSHQR